MQLTYSKYRMRRQAYDKTVKNLQVKDCKGLASIAIPEIDEAEEVVLNMYELSMTEGRISILIHPRSVPLPTLMDPME